MKPNEESKNRPTQIWSINFLQKHQGKSMEKEMVLQQLNIHSLLIQKELKIEGSEWEQQGHIQDPLVR